MTEADPVFVGAVIGAIGTAAVLAAGRRIVVAAGFALLGVAEALLATELVPDDIVDSLARPLALAALAIGSLVVGSLAALFVARPELVPLSLLIAAPFRLPLHVGGQEAFLLIPLYVVLAAAVIAFLYRLLRGAPARRLPTLLVAPAGIYLGLSALSLTWSEDREQGAIQVFFFLLPFAALIAVVARAPLASWLPRAAAAAVVALAGLFSLVGLWQAATGRVFFARDIEVANAYAPFFRVTSLFKDPSLYGRFVVLAIVLVVTAFWLQKVRAGTAAVVVAFLFAGLYFSYSQSSFATLFAVVAAVTLVLGDRLARMTVATACAAIVIATTVFVAVTVDDSSARKYTSGRSRLVGVTLPVIRDHPVVGVGVGAQPLASSDEDASEAAMERNASHTTPLTVAAELGALGILAYVALLVAATVLFARVTREDRPLGLGLAASFLVLFVHSLVYAGFFEDPLMWGAFALAAAAAAERRTAGAPATTRRGIGDRRREAVAVGGATTG